MNKIMSKCNEFFRKESKNICRVEKKHNSKHYILNTSGITGLRFFIFFFSK